MVEILSVVSGSIVGLILGLIGGGGSILAVPLLIYVVGIGSTHMALGTSAFAVGSAALVNLVPHWRAKNVKWPCAIVFSIAGVAGAAAGSSIAKLINGDILLAAFGGLMIIVGALMLRNRNATGNPDVHLERSNAFTLGPRLALIGLGVGLISGFFGIGGGFLIVPGLMLGAGMPIKYAVGTSLVSVSAFGFTTAGSYALSNQIDWKIAIFFIIGAALGGIFGRGIGGYLDRAGNLLQTGFAVLVIVLGLWIAAQGSITMLELISTAP